MIAKAARQTRIVQNHRDAAAALSREIDKALRRQQLMAQVKMLQGLIEKIEGRVLRQQQRQARALAFAAGQC